MCVCIVVIVVPTNVQAVISIAVVVSAASFVFEVIEIPVERVAHVVAAAVAVSRIVVMVSKTQQ